MARINPQASCDYVHPIPILQILSMQAHVASLRVGFAMSGREALTMKS